MRRRGGVIDVQVALKDSLLRIYKKWVIPGSGDKAMLGSQLARELLGQVVPRFVREYAAPKDLEVNIAALDAYLNGEDAFERDRWTEAELDFTEALRLDPAFARAAWRLYNAQAWRRVTTHVELASLLRLHGDRLSTRDRLLVQAQLAPHGRQRYAIYDAVLDSFPQDAYVLLLYGAEVFHRGPLAGIPLDSAALLLDEAVTRNPTLAPAEDHLLWALIRLGYRARAESALVRLRRNALTDSLSEVDPPDALQMAWMARFAPGEFARQLPAVPGTLQPYLFKTMRLALSLDIPEAERGLGAMLATLPGAKPSDRASGHEAQGLALVALGQGLAALAHFDTAAALFGTPEARMQAAEWRIVPAALGLWDTTGLDQGSWRAALQQQARTGGPLAARAAWALALDALARHDTADARRWRIIVHDRGRSGGSAARLDALLEARAAAARQDYQEALRRSNALLADDALQPGTERLLLGDPFARTALHVLRGAWYAQLGQHARADTSWLWYENSDFEGWLVAEAQAAEMDWAFSARARLGRADAALARGDTLIGCPFLRRVHELWSAPDGSTKSAAARTRQLLAACP